ncbi:hypothetical protein EDM68_00965 [Candidatus Uhrbacteria bacterium]|nr:MAG: hypothetical protein EDM68_00965 [Candidatus Uhrbacteria bacterium]
MAFGPFERVRQQWQAWPAETRFSVGVLGACGAAVVILSVMYFRSGLDSPFRVPTAKLLSAQEKLQTISASNEAREAERLKGKDTDRDGLSDYAELTIYKTSPYLADSDSDGIPDAIEIAQGTDPNCPIGQSCGAIANADLQPSYNVSSSYSNLLQATQVRTVENVAQEFILNAPDPSAVTARQARDLLVQSRLIPAEQLTGLSDADILLLYRATHAQVMQIRAGIQNPTESPSADSEPQPTP